MDKETNRIREKGDSGRCKKQRSKKTYSRKRKNPNKGKKLPPKVPRLEANPGDQNVTADVNNADNDTPSTSTSTVSSQKIEEILMKDNDELLSENIISGFRLVDMNILSSVLTFLACPQCLSTRCLFLHETESKRKGLSSYLQIECIECKFKHGFYTSPKIITSKDKKKRGMHTMEINTRAVYGFRSIGVGHASLTKLCGKLNMPPPMSQSSYNYTANLIKSACKNIAEKSMSEAASRLRKNKSVADVGVSVDGTWQRKGFSSTLGVITAISVDIGKVLDVAILSKSCKGCTKMKKVVKSNPKLYERWKLTHRCNLNHKGSSPAMEQAGAKLIFERSIAKHNLCYTSFYGDGDSKAYPAVIDTYEKQKKKIEKMECIGHYQKRVGCRLRKLKQTTKGLGGRGKLTDAKIDVLQNYFGIALRQNTGNLDAMKQSCLASMYHVAGYHESCPKSSNSWCQYQADKINNTNNFKSKGELPVDVRKAILPIYKDLCKEEMLAKCLHGKTQNPNESFNGTIWNRVPKANHVGLSTLCFGVYDAIAHFNYGEKAALDTMKLLNVNPGYYMTKSCSKVNKKRIRQSAYKMSSPQKKRRAILRHSKKKGNDKITEEEGTVYEAGGF